MNLKKKIMKMYVWWPGSISDYYPGVIAVIAFLLAAPTKKAKPLA